MFVEQLRRAVEASPRVELAKVSALLWKAYAAGTVSESDAADLSALIEARKAAGAVMKNPRRLVGTRPRTSASMDRRRRWAASGRLPPQIAVRFTLAEQAVLAVVAAEAAKRGACTLTLDHIAAWAGVCRSTVKNALREARQHGLLHIEERRVSAWRNAPNRITVVAKEWRAWLRLARLGGGGKTVPPTPTEEKNTATAAQRNRGWATNGQGAGGQCFNRKRPLGLIA